MKIKCPAAKFRQLQRLRAEAGIIASRIKSLEDELAIPRACNMKPGESVEVVNGNNKPMAVVRYFNHSGSVIPAHIRKRIYEI